MLDLKWIRDNPEALDEGLAKRHHAPAAQELLAMDEKLRHVQTELQELQNQRNTLAKEIGQKKKAGEDASDLMDKAQVIKDKTPDLEEQERSLSHDLKDALSRLPNLPDADVPVGKSEDDNVQIREHGTPRSFDFEVKQHFEIGEDLGLMDFETAAKISGSRFVVLKGDLARMERALGAFMIDVHTTDFGYQEVAAPLLVRSESVFGTGQLPKFKEDLFETTDGRWLIPTSEVPITNIMQDKTIAELDLPLRSTAYSHCFRSEAGAAGKDTRGMIRQHQFSKVELVSHVHPDKSEDEHERMTNAAEEILKRLGLPYRVMLLCSGDMGGTARKTYDLEVWVPGENTYREISSCSNCGDYQARRMNARFKPMEGGKPQFVHTLNGSGLAVGRTLVAIIENYQQADGSVMIPEALVPYMNNKKVISRDSI